MAILEIFKYPDSILKKKAKIVERIDDDIKGLINDMAETMFRAPGLGLAAPQVGKSLRIAVINISTPEKRMDFLSIINPHIVLKEGSITNEEGCLSVPGFRTNVKRFSHIAVEALNPDGKEFKIEADGLISIVLQHEIDHLEGILFIDRISRLKRDAYKRELVKRLKRDVTDSKSQVRL